MAERGLVPTSHLEPDWTRSFADDISLKPFKTEVSRRSWYRIGRRWTKRWIQIPAKIVTKMEANRVSRGFLLRRVFLKGELQPGKRE